MFKFDRIPMHLSIFLFVHEAFVCWSLWITSLQCRVVLMSVDVDQHFMLMFMICDTHFSISGGIGFEAFNFKRSLTVYSLGDFGTSPIFALPGAFFLLGRPPLPFLTALTQVWHPFPLCTFHKSTSMFGLLPLSLYNTSPSMFGLLPLFISFCTLE